uniref:Uncharacterized protein n=1 Tax=Tanacetum cinerariifolium TaxID=118510 RepID=A0A6L2J9C0_TANCI|nr:hypothetical protein [Tanacetum cinerariifolium]
MARINVGRGGRGRGGCDLSDHAAAHGSGQKSKDQPNTNELFKWEGLSDVLVYDAWENSMKKRYLDIMLNARRESVKLAQAATYNGALVDKYRSDPTNHPIYNDDLLKQSAKMMQKVKCLGGVPCQIHST